jgi:hypothetical protein
MSKMNYYTAYQFTNKQGTLSVCAVHSLDVEKFLEEYPDAVALQAG